MALQIHEECHTQWPYKACLSTHIWLAICCLPFTMSLWSLACWLCARIGCVVQVTSGIMNSTIPWDSAYLWRTQQATTMSTCTKKVKNGVASSKILNLLLSDPKARSTITHRDECVRLNSSSAFWTGLLPHSFKWYLTLGKARKKPRLAPYPASTR
jgi:hypothetical protein